MAIEKISTTVAAQPVQHDTPLARRLPAQGDTVQVALDKVEGEDLLVIADGSLPLRLTGLAHLASELAPGDMLLMRVLTTSPRLTLSLIDTLASGDAANSTAGRGTGYAPEASSMRTDQLALRQIAWPKPVPESLATAWRSQILASFGQKAPHPATASLPLSLLAVIDHQARLPNDATTAPSNNDRWIFPAFGWDGLPVMLRLIDVDPDERRAPRRQLAVALRLEFDLPGFGRVSTQILLTGAEVALELIVEDKNAVQVVRDALPAIAAALARIGLRIHSCRVMHGSGNDATLPSWSASDMALVRQALTPALFRAGTEIMLALSAAASASRSAPTRLVF